MKVFYDLKKFIFICDFFRVSAGTGRLQGHLILVVEINSPFCRTFSIKHVVQVLNSTLDK
jgi:hypothetical protein